MTSALAPVRRAPADARAQTTALERPYQNSSRTLTPRNVAPLTGDIPLPPVASTVPPRATQAFWSELASPRALTATNGPSLRLSPLAINSLPSTPRELPRGISLRQIGDGSTIPVAQREQWQLLEPDRATTPRRTAMYGGEAQREIARKRLHAVACCEVRRRLALQAEVERMQQQLRDTTHHSEVYFLPLRSTRTHVELWKDQTAFS